MRAWLIIALVIANAGCSDLFRGDGIDIRVPDVSIDISDVSVDPTSGKAIGAACDARAPVSDCRFGLACISGVCRTRGDTLENRPCILTAECGDGLYCGFVGACQAAGSGVAGSACATTGECQRGFVCRSFGFAGACVAGGAGDLDAPCDGVEDCMAGLSCGPGGSCAAGSPLFGLRPWTGVSCAAAPSDTETPVIHFKVPRDGVEGDFFSLPFPNDIRMKGGTLDLSGFPTPGPGLVGFDPVARAIDAAEKVQRGFSTEPVVTFRLSHGFKLETVRAASDPVAGAPTLYFRNIDKDSPQYSWTPDFSYFVTDGGSKYICPRYVSVRPTWNGPLLPGTTYAVILARGIETNDTSGASQFQADRDMAALLAPSRPGDPVLGAAWDAYAPLRAYVADPVAEIPLDRVIAAAVFTTQAVSDVLPAVRAAIHAGSMPVPAGLVECKPGVVSPCEDGLVGDAHVRGCFSESPLVHELHMRLPLPRIQAGTRPYLAPEDGGDLAFVNGAPTLQGTEDVCVSLTIPKGQAMPAAGWPIAVYGHGTGGSFRSAVSDAGEALAAIDLAGATIGIAALGWDGPMHGDRRGADLDPGALFYNLANPAAARGNLLQGAADVFALVRVLKAWSLDAAASPTGEAIRFDPLKIMLIGHSQGATTGPLAAPYEPDVRNVVWSGAGAGLVLSLLNKTEPVDAASAGAVALQELDGNGVPRRLDDMHPALALIQGLFDAVDPLNHGRLATVDRDASHPIQHVLMTYGIGDSYTPNVTGRALARALRAGLVKPALEDFGTAFPPLDAPVRENVAVPGGRASVVIAQARPDGYDGHFVMFRDAALKRRYQQWMATFVRDDVPTLVP